MQAALNNYLARVAEDVNLARQELWEALKPLRAGTPGKKNKQFLRAVPFITDSQGNPFQDPTQLADAWVDMFAKVEGGFPS